MRKALLFASWLAIGSSAFSQTADQMRQDIAQAVVDLKVPQVAVASVQNTIAIWEKDTVVIRIYKPSNKKNLPVIYHIHGGAFVGGDLNTHDNICRVLCKESEAIVVAVDYRRPPESKWPAAVNDSYIVLRWIHKNMRDLGGNGRIILIGDSAGGNLAPAITLKNAEEKKPVPIKGIILINPAVDARKGSPADKRYGEFIDMYLPDSADRSNYTISPITSTHLDQFPQTLIILSEKDELHDEGQAFDQALESKGVKTVLYEQKGANHFGPLWCAAAPQVQPSLRVVLGLIKVWIKE